ncbi:MAG: TrmB family transcriptional regulator [Chloroflexi bacterium]|nr:TrmB family transcriptional regulator [Chloroflexota bacterium]MBU1747771.1 TrmB family transcriptional regulator [Chloroflexota bacterium]MBU1879139.1 TrmB family transcriptional regulator [Chloroflexota bacterium]
MDVLTGLAAMGFTEYEAKVYMALLREYPATGYQISKTSGVPRSMVYAALGRLHVRGAVLETRDERATLYRPLPPDVLLDQHEQEQRDLLGAMREGLRKLYEPRDEDRVWSISKRRSVLSYAIQMIQQAQAEVYLVLADPDLAALHEDIRAACGRGVAVSALLTGAAELDCGQVARHAPLESQLQGLTDTLMVIADGREVMVARSDTEMTATITRNPNLVLIARQFVWMELLAQRIHTRLGPDLLARLDPADRQIFEGLTA